jgi:hypothetical protein
MPASNPLHINLFQGLNVDPGAIDVLKKKIDEADEARQEWLLRTEKLTRQRFGIKGNKKRTVPFPGASDLRIPTQDKAVRRWKPKIVSLVYDADPVAYFKAQEPSDVESARVTEQFYDWLFKIEMSEALYEINLLADLIAHRGLAYLQISWDYATEDETRMLYPRQLWPDGVQDLEDIELLQDIIHEFDVSPEELDPGIIDAVRGGAEGIALFFRAVTRNRPRITARDPAQVIMPPRVTDVEASPFVCVQHQFDEGLLDCYARDGIFDPDAVALIKSKIQGTEMGANLASSGHDMRQLELRSLDKKEGIEEGKEDQKRVVMWEIFTWSAAPERRRIKLWVHPKSNTVAAAMPYPFPFHSWPLVLFQHEITYRRLYASRGLTRMLSPLAREVDRLHNARLDAISIQLAPAFKYRAPAGAAPRTFRFMPGKIFPVSQMTDLEPLVFPTNNLQAFTAEEYQTRALVEDYAGLADTAVMNPLRAQERRTATEIDFITNQMQGAFALDAKIFQMSMQKVHQMVWELWYEFGPEQVFFRVANEEMPRPFLKSEVSRRYDIVPAGTPANTNRLLELNKAREAMQIFMQDQSGLIDRAELYRYYLDLLDFNLAKRVLNSPEKAWEIQTMMQAAAMLQQGNLGDLMMFSNAAKAAQVQGNVVPGSPPLA